MRFEEFSKALNEHLEKMMRSNRGLFQVAVDKDEMYNKYLDSYPLESNKIYRTRREFDCSCCHSFVKRMGNVVALIDGKVVTIWGFHTGDDVYQPMLDAMDAYIKGKTISDVFFSGDEMIGTPVSREQLEDGTIVKWNHMAVKLPKRYVIDKRFNSVEAEQGIRRDTRNVFKRSLEEISIDATETVLELIGSNSLYRGEEWLGILQKFLKYQKEYAGLDATNKELYTWMNASAAGMSIGRIRNHSIGTLLVNISEGMDLDEAVRKYEQIVAPTNYKRPKAIFTKKMLEDAKKEIEKLGYMDSLARRFARLDDITVNNILFANRDAAKKMGGGDIFAEMAGDVAVNPKRFSKVEEIGIDKFVSDVLPGAREVEVLLENRHSGNLVSLIAPENVDAPSMFKWNNGFSWAYSGNVADSMKQRVKAAGGKVDGDLRFSIQWNEDGKDACDLDAHCKEVATNTEIYYGSYRGRIGKSPCGGNLDVDIIDPGKNIAVENIVYADKTKMKPGQYAFFVHQFSGSAKSGFRAEIEFDGNIYSYDYSSPMQTGKRVQVAIVSVDKDHNLLITHLLKESASGREVWGLKTNQFVPASVIMMSPNYWDEQKGIGNRHFFFMLKGCINPENPNGMFNEYLKEELLKHKRVFEALGVKTAVKDDPEQLSGIGFSATKHDNVIVKVKGNTERTMKVIF